MEHGHVRAALGDREELVARRAGDGSGRAGRGRGVERDREQRVVAVAAHDDDAAAVGRRPEPARGCLLYTSPSPRD